MDHNASSSIFGWHFQINSAIVYFIKYIKDIKSIRIERKDEDIELLLFNEKKILIQAKSYSKLGKDSKALKKLETGLNTLFLGAQKNEIDKLIYTTNFPNPIGGTSSQHHIFMGDGIIERTFNEIPANYKKKVVEIIEKLSEKYNKKYNTDILNISVINFDGEDYETRYRTILRIIREFLSNISVNPFYSKKLLEIWQSEFLFNATTSNVSIDLTKNQVIWPIIVMNSQLLEDDKNFEKLIDEFQMDEEEIEIVLYKYTTFIDKQSEKFSFVMKVNSDYEIYRKNKIGNERGIKSFINDKWTDYIYLVNTDKIEEEVKQIIVKIILFKILNLKTMVKKLKKEVKLEI